MRLRARIGMLGLALFFASVPRSWGDEPSSTAPLPTNPTARSPAASVGDSIASADSVKIAGRSLLVFKAPGRYGGWPANHGIWSWGDEVVVGFTSAVFKSSKTDHSVDRSKPFAKMQARSFDGGETWTIEQPLNVNPEAGPPRTKPLAAPLDFTAPGFALMFDFANMHVGPTYFYVSTDRCQSWRGPYTFQVEGVDKIAARTDYLVLGPRECLMFGSAAKSNDREGQSFCAKPPMAASLGDCSEKSAPSRSAMRSCRRP